MRSWLNALISTAVIAACGSVNSVPDAGEQVDAAGLVPPTGVIATANVDLGARINWAAPTSGTVTEYTVTVSPPGGSAVVAGTSAVVTGLSVGESYTFTVTATFEEGGAAASAPSNAVTIVAGPAAPTELTACGADSQATVRAQVADPPASYNIYFGMDAGVSKLTGDKVSTVTLPYVHAGLTNGTKLHYTITAVDGAGVESADATPDSTTPDGAVHDAVFGSSYASSFQFVESIDCLGKYPDASVGAGRKLEGQNTGIADSPYYNNFALDAANAVLYYRMPTSIRVFANATRVEGNVAPTRTITSTALTSGEGIVIDTTRDLLYVGNGSSILVFANASTANGNVNPVRTIAAQALANVRAFALDVANDRLYVANYTDVLVINKASTSNGTVTPARTITIANATMTTFGVALDTSNDLLYISSRNAGTIASVQASTANGAVVPLRTITGVNTPMGISVVNNTLYMMSDNGNNAIHSWENANTIKGFVAPKSIKFPTLSATAGFVYAP